MGDPVDDGVRLLRIKGRQVPLMGDGELDDFVRNIIAPAVQAVEQYRDETLAEWKQDIEASAIAATVQAERERIRTGVDALIPAGLYPAENRNINNVIDGKRQGKGNDDVDD